MKLNNQDKVRRKRDNNNNLNQKASLWMLREDPLELLMMFLRIKIMMIALVIV